MSRVLYFDCFSGISGDMVLGALLDAGLPFAELERALGSLAVSGYEIEAKRVMRAGISATKFVVHQQSGGSPAIPDIVAGRLKTEEESHGQHAHPHDGPPEGGHHVQQGGSHRQHSHLHGHEHEQSGEHHAGHDHGHRSLAEIFELIDRSALSSAGRDRARALFHRLAEAEAAIHEMPLDRIHLHEVGALDSIIDIVGAVFGLAWFDADTIVCSPLNVGGGTVKSAHGILPVPAPATVRLLGDAPIYSGPVQQELVTPTGALIATSYATTFGAIPPMAIERVGYGAGDRDHPHNANVLRVFVGRAAGRHETDRTGFDRVSVIECEIDDMNPQIFGVVMDRLYAAGALEVFYVPVQMKKNRPGTLLTVIAPLHVRAAISDIVFAETTTIGLRHYDVDRECLPREVITVATPVGDIRFKVSMRGGRIINAAPEFDDMVRAAAAHHVSVKDVQALAVRAYGEAHAGQALRQS